MNKIRVYLGIVICAALVTVFASCGFYYKHEAKKYMLRTRFDTAIEMYTKAIAENPDDSTLHHGLGLAYLGRFHKAVMKKFLDSDRAAMLSDEQIKALYVEMNNKAISEFRKALELDPSDHKAAYDLGLLYFKGGANDKSREVFKQAIEYEPKFAEAHLYYGISLGFDKKLGHTYDPKELVDRYDDIVLGIEEIEYAMELKPNLRMLADAFASLEKLKKLKLEIDKIR
jgi:tetratricopeptide (TPR) repeat protein